ncbi:MAG: helix-turn-helix transcriptional regulator [Candidatus Omnitrophota bacterium]
MNITKYFWDLNDVALKEAVKILNNPGHPKYLSRMFSLLSRCDKPKDLFSVISKKDFIDMWPRLRSYWVKVGGPSDFRDWWEAIYEQLIKEYSIKETKNYDNSSISKKIGEMIKRERINRNFSQKELALRVGMKQPDVSEIEEGKKNITLDTLSRLCKVLEIGNIEIG